MSVESYYIKSSPKFIPVLPYERFGRGFDIVKTHFKKRYCKVLQIHHEILFAKFLNRNISWNITKRFQKPPGKDFFISLFLERFGRGFDIVKTHFKKCYCDVLQNYLEIFLAKFLHRDISWNITKRIQKPFL